MSRSIIENRVNALGASEATVQIQGDDQILVQIPGLSDTEEALNAIGRTGKLEFARLDSFTDEDVRQSIDSGAYIQQETVSDDYGNTFVSGTSTYLKVEDGTYTPIVTGSNIKNVQIAQDQSGMYWTVNLDLDAEGTEAFAQATEDLAPTNGKIVIILDNEVNSAPAVQSEITARCRSPAITARKKPRRSRPSWKADRFPSASPTTRARRSAPLWDRTPLPRA